MTRSRKLALAAALVAAALLLCGVSSAATVAAYFTGPSAPTASGCGATSGGGSAAPARTVPVPGFTGEQVANAAIIVRVGQRLGVSPRGWVVAVATAMQESNLHNLGHLGERNDHDSQGLFQQRPSQGWGTVTQIRDPEYAAGKFYGALAKVKGWAALPLTAAAQRVQRSAFPGAYAKHEPRAALLVDAVTGGGAKAGPVAARCAAPTEVTAGGWVAPVRGQVGSGFRTASRPNHQGVDIAVSRQTAIRAAASGTVTRVRCNAIAPDGSDWGCDRDGSPRIKGCGWYVDLAHAGGVITRYCHMIQRPAVGVGQRVAAGELLGLSGTSGNSSGPHLHFEVHRDGDQSSRGAIDPVRFLADRGVKLGA